MNSIDLDQPPSNSATAGSTLRSENADLTLTEIEIIALWSIQGNYQQDLADFVMAVFSESVAACGMTSTDDLRLLKLWPQRAWLLAHRHGLCEFRLGGEHAWAFLGSYTSVDLAAPVGSGCRRCLLGQYPLVLWWDDIGGARDIHLLIERSYAQSFFDYLAQLMTRWRATTS
jgi:hypothetical protein